MGIIGVFPKNTTTVQGIPIGRLNNIDNRVKILENSGGGSGFTLLTTSGTIDGINTTFPYFSKPLYVISDGLWYRENKGWTWDGANVNMSIPPTYDNFAFK